MKKKALLYILAAGMVIILSLVMYTFRSSPDSVENLRAEVETTAYDIASEYEMDENVANSSYLDKIVQVEGTLMEIDQKDDKVYLYLEGGLTANVSCMFSTGSITTEALEPGQNLVVKGKCTGYILDVVLTKCSLIE